MENTIEQQIAKAILQKDVAQLTIDGRTYKIAPPSIATLILVSEIISTLPVVEKATDSGKIVSSVLHHARHFKRLGDIAAILILGAKGINADCADKPTLFGWFKRKRRSQADKLAQAIIDNVRPSVLWDLIVNRLNMHEIGDFFAITTSLSEANLLKPTKEVEG